jgi:PAS domain S-box-containing protein
MQQPDRKLTLGSVQVVVSDAQLQRKLAADKRFQTRVLLAQAVALLIIGLLVYRRILAPISKLTVAAGRIERGQFDTRIALTQKDEIGLLAHRMDAMQTSLKTLFDEQAAILGNIPAGVLFVREDGIAFANDAAQSMLAINGAGLTTLASAQIFEDAQQQSLYVNQTLLRPHGATGEIVLLKRADGRSFPAELHTAVIDGTRQGDQIWVIIDVSERLEAESRIDRLAFYDPVTDLPNKKLFLDRLRRGLGRQQARLRWWSLYGNASRRPVARPRSRLTMICSSRNARDGWAPVFAPTRRCGAARWRLCAGLRPADERTGRRHPLLRGAGQPSSPHWPSHGPP